MSKYIFELDDDIKELECAASFHDGILTLEDGTCIEFAQAHHHVVSKHYVGSELATYFAGRIDGLINVLLEVSRHSDSLMKYVLVDDNQLDWLKKRKDEHDRIIRLVNDTVAKYGGIENA
ncbi:hypothetical protein CMO96_01670 [Candidatus Woesebacteria bacterium]|nr:hypothetical protein [Candidatus Woesebacteria bacterium]